MPSKIRKRGETSYELCVTDGYAADGRQRIYRETVQAANITEAKELYKQFAARVINGSVIASDVPKMSLTSYYSYWTKNHVEKQNAVTTKSHHDNLFPRIEAVLGHLRIDKIKPAHVLAFIDQISQPDASINNTPLSGRTIKDHYSLLKTMLNSAVQWDLIPENPCNKVKPPKISRSQKKIPSEIDLATFFDKLINAPLKNRLWCMLAFALGLRREEIFGLQWGDIDFASSTLTIDRAAVSIPKKGIIIKDCKTDNSHRKLSAPSEIMSLLILWQQEIKDQAKQRAKRNKVVEFVDPVAPDRWLFPQANGSVGHPHSVTSFIRRFCIDNELPPLSPHLLRHLSGSYLIKQGTDLATVSKKLGHANKAFTMQTYIHSLESAEKQTADTMQGILDNLKTKKGQAN